jgi:hypothetical protein
LRLYRARSAKEKAEAQKRCYNEFIGHFVLESLSEEGNRRGGMSPAPIPVQEAEFLLLETDPGFSSAEAQDFSRREKHQTKNVTT